MIQGGVKRQYNYKITTNNLLIPFLYIFLYLILFFVKESTIYELTNQT
jgi:hypothetical protein